MNLKPHQLEVEGDLISSVKSGHNRVILNGAAGVGKTVVAGDIVEKVTRDYRINPNYNNGTIYVTAPTNKALSILQKKIPDKYGKICFKTIHSALGMRLVTNEKTGTRKFIPGFSPTKRGQEFQNCKLCIIDEASMVNTEILEFLKDYKFPIIFIGDQFQINPVGELKTPVFNQNYPVFTLKEIIRQGAGNPIIDLSRDIDMIWFKKPRLIDGKGYTYDNNKQQLIDSLAEVNGTDELKFIAWTNEHLDKMNILVRERIYGENPMRVEKNEILVFNAPLEDYYTNQEVKVEDLKIVTDYVPLPQYNTKYLSMGEMVGMGEIKMKYYLINDSFKIVHEDSDLLFKAVCDQLTQNCKVLGWNWKGKYFFEEQFGDIKYNHAISVHKAQGSTYKEVILDIANINLNKNAEEKQRLLYTAVTRASDLVILNNVR